MTLTRPKENITSHKKYLKILLYVFLGFAVIGSQFSIAVSSVGVGGLIILIPVWCIVNKNVYYGGKYLMLLFLLLILSQGISSAFSADPSYSFTNILKKISIYIVFFAAIITTEDTKNLQKFLAVFFAVTAIVSIIETTRFIIDYNSITKPLAAFRLEYYGFPITNGEIKMLILLMMIPLMFMKKEFILNKWILVLLCLPVLFTFYLTNARNAILGLVTGLLTYGILKNKYFLAGVVIVIAGFLLLAPMPLKERVLSIADMNHPSNHSRIVMWETGMKMIKDNLLFGIGDVDVKKAYEKYKKPEFHGEGSHMHNNVIHITLTLGLLGLITWLGLMIYIFYKQVKIYIASKEDELLNILAVISLISMIAFQISGLTEWNFGDSEFAAVLWFSLALAFIAEKLHKPKTNG